MLPDVHRDDPGILAGNPDSYRESRWKDRGACPAAAKRKRGRAFCSHGTMFIEQRQCRGAMLISSQFTVPVQDDVNGHWRSVAPKVLTEQSERHGV